MITPQVKHRCLWSGVQSSFAILSGCQSTVISWVFVAQDVEIAISRSFWSLCHESWEQGIFDIVFFNNFTVFSCFFLSIYLINLLLTFHIKSFNVIDITTTKIQIPSQIDEKARNWKKKNYITKNNYNKNEDRILCSTKLQTSQIHIITHEYWCTSKK